jgi:hypothetical protein
MSASRFAVTLVAAFGALTTSVQPAPDKPPRLPERRAGDRAGCPSRPTRARGRSTRRASTPWPPALTADGPADIEARLELSANGARRLVVQQTGTFMHLRYREVTSGGPDWAAIELRTGDKPPSGGRRRVGVDGPPTRSSPAEGSCGSRSPGAPAPRRRPPRLPSSGRGPEARSTRASRTPTASPGSRSCAASERAPRGCGRSGPRARSRSPGRGSGDVPRTVKSADPKARAERFVRIDLPLAPGGADGGSARVRARGARGLSCARRRPGLRRRSLRRSCSRRRAAHSLYLRSSTGRPLAAAGPDSRGALLRPSHDFPPDLSWGPATTVSHVLEHRSHPPFPARRRPVRPRDSPLGRRDRRREAPRRRRRSPRGSGRLHDRAHPVRACRGGGGRGGARARGGGGRLRPARRGGLSRAPASDPVAGRRTLGDHALGERDGVFLDRRLPDHRHRRGGVEGPVGRAPPAAHLLRVAAVFRGGCGRARAPHGPVGAGGARVDPRGRGPRSRGNGPVPGGGGGALAGAGRGRERLRGREHGARRQQARRQRQARRRRARGGPRGSDGLHRQPIEGGGALRGHGG